jgi:hypothetical protein
MRKGSMKGWGRDERACVALRAYFDEDEDAIPQTELDRKSVV